MIVGKLLDLAKRPNQNRQSDSLNMSQLTVSQGMIKMGAIADNDDYEWKPIKQVTGPCDGDSVY